MKKLLFIVLLMGMTPWSIAQTYIYKTYESDECEPDCFQFVNQAGEVVIPAGKYMRVDADTIFHFAWAITGDGSKWVAVNAKGEETFDAYLYDSGPDYVQEGLFRIVKYGLIGFANEKGEVVIEPQYKCAHYFEGGKAKVTYFCDLKDQGEAHSMESKSWFYIDKKGNKVSN